MPFQDQTPLQKEGRSENLDQIDAGDVSLGPYFQTQTTTKRDLESEEKLTYERATENKQNVKLFLQRHDREHGC